VRITLRIGPLVANSGLSEVEQDLPVLDIVVAELGSNFGSEPCRAGAGKSRATL
jgi:hypothetical protein